MFFPVFFSSFYALFGAFFAFCASRVIFGHVFLDLGVVFAPFSSFRVLFLYSFRNFCGFWLDITVLPGWIGGFSPSFCSFSLFSFMFLPCFFVFRCSRVIFGGVFLFFFRFFVLLLCPAFCCRVFVLFFRSFLPFCASRVNFDVFFLIFWFSFRFSLVFSSRVIFDAFLRIFTAFRGFSFGFLCFLRLFLKNFVSFLLQILPFLRKISSSFLIFPRVDGFFLFFFAFLALVVFPCFFLFSFSRFRRFSLVFSAFYRCLLVCFLLFLLFENARSRFSSLFVLYALRADFVRPRVLLLSCRFADGVFFLRALFLFF